MNHGNVPRTQESCTAAEGSDGVLVSRSSLSSMMSTAVRRPVAQAGFQAALLALFWGMLLLHTCIGGSRELLFLSYLNSTPRQPHGPRSTHPACPSPASKTVRRARERRRAEQSPRSRGPNPRVLTSKISKAESAASILEVVGEEVDNEVFNDFHMSAAFTRLAKFSKRRQLGRADRGSSVWPRLVAR